jgi:hypothetical protein
MLKFLKLIAGRSAMQYTSGDVSKLMSFTPGAELQPPVSNFLPRRLTRKSNVATMVCIFAYLGILW